MLNDEPCNGGSNYAYTYSVSPCGLLHTFQTSVLGLQVHK